MASAGTEDKALLFADIVGSTLLFGELGDLSASRIVTDFLNVAAEAATRHDGSITKVFGDGFVAIFDDVNHALAFARDLHRAQSSIATTAGPLRVRFSIHLGKVQVMHTSYGREVVGTALNVAARLNTIAPPDGIAISRVAMQQLPA